MLRNGVKCFKCEAKGEKNINLPAESGPISQILPPIVIKEDKQAVAKMIKLQGKCNPYLRLVDNTKKVEITKSML